MSAPELSPAQTAPGVRLTRAEWSWALYEWGRTPYVLLCIIYVLSPYIATVVIGDPVRGQELISGWHRTAGLIVACTAPFLGAAADRMGRRKPLLAAITLVMGLAMIAQYWALPGDAGLPLWGVGAAIIVAGVAYTWSEVLHNAMLTGAARAPLVSFVSGLGLALGNAASVLMFLFVLWAWALPGVLDLPFLPERPLFGLDPATHQTSRIVGPLCGVWLMLFAIPLFRYVRDLNSSGERFLPALRHGVGNVIATLRKLKEHRNIAAFLVARMLYTDGKVSILLFIGVYASGVMGWGFVEMLALGVVSSVFAMAGGLVAGPLDAVLGPKRAVLLEVSVTLACLIVLVSVTQDSVFFVVPALPGQAVWSGPIFKTLPEVVYLGTFMVMAVAITAAFASSRSFMARLAPKGMEGELFGLYALAGTATSWLGPSLIAYFTGAYHSQRIGFAALGTLLVAGLLLLLPVKPPPAQQH